MDCHKAIELVPEYVVDTLSSEDRAALQRHLDEGCQRCRQELDEQAEAASLLGEALHPVNPRAELRAKLLEQIDSEPQLPTTEIAPSTRQHESKANTGDKPFRLIDCFPFVAASLLAVAAGSLLANVANRQSVDDSLVQVELQLKEQWQRRIIAAEQAFGPPRAQIVGLNATSEQQFQAAIFYDRIAKQLHVMASQVPPPPAGQHPYLWLLDPEGRVLTGNPLKYIDFNRAAAIVDLPSLPKNIAGALITYESSGNPSEPRGTVVRRTTLKQTS